MQYIDYTYEDKANNRDLDIRIHFSPVPYTPARITADPGDSYPEDGGYCEDFIFNVIAAHLYDEMGNTIKATPEELKQLTEEFDNLFENDKKMQKFINELCTDSYRNWCECMDDYDGYDRRREDY